MVLMRKGSLGTVISWNCQPDLYTSPSNFCFFSLIKGSYYSGQNVENGTGALTARGLKLPVVYVALLGKTQDFPPHGLSFHALQFVECFSELLLTSKINSLLRFSQSWEELTQRDDSGCSGFVEGAQNRRFSSKIYFSFKYSQFNILGSRWWRDDVFQMLVPSHAC